MKLEKQKKAMRVLTSIQFFLDKADALSMDEVSDDCEEVRRKLIHFNSLFIFTFFVLDTASSFQCRKSGIRFGKERLEIFRTLSLCLSLDQGSSDFQSIGIMQLREPRVWIFWG